VVCTRDDTFRNEPITSTILRSIRESDLIIADVSRQNPNVFYEIGFAHALRKPTILLANLNSERRLPSDLSGLDYIVYDLADLQRLSDRVQSAATRSLGMQRSA
jgi:nucleoside 2-deoxyribosyltransferase